MHDGVRQRAGRRAQRDQAVPHAWVRAELVHNRRVLLEQPRQQRPRRGRVGRPVDRLRERGCVEKRLGHPSSVAYETGAMSGS